MKKIVRILVVCMILLLPNIVFAHSGDTDSSGGHHDNKNKSGLGSYHYHHGMGPHLHPNGICPYSASTQTKQNESNESEKLNNNKVEEEVIHTQNPVSTVKIEPTQAPTQMLTPSLMHTPTIELTITTNTPKVTNTPDVQSNVVKSSKNDDSGGVFIVFIIIIGIVGFIVYKKKVKSKLKIKG